MKRRRLLSYPRFLWDALGEATDGGAVFYAWMTVLSALGLIGANAWAHQVNEGMGITAMTDHVSWGLYIGNFTYAVGLSAGSVLLLIPAFVFGKRSLRDVALVGQILAIAAIVGALAFVVVDIGRPDAAWHMIPGLGRFNWPLSLLTWDVVLFFGYLVVNSWVVSYLLYQRYRGEEPDKRWYLPFVFLSIVWAIALCAEEAFLYSGLGGRPFWNTAILAPRFLCAAFISAPASVVLALQISRRFSSYEVDEEAFDVLQLILKVACLFNFFLLAAEVFTELYTGGAHVASATYLYFGLHGHDALVPWIRSAIGMNLVATVLFLVTDHRKRPLLLSLACLLAIVGVWIEKGMGLIVPAFVPSTLHEIVEYLPNRVEVQVSVGVFALVLGIYTLGLKLASAVFTGEMRARH